MNGQQQFPYFLLHLFPVQKGLGHLLLFFQECLSVNKTFLRLQRTSAFMVRTNICVCEASHMIQLCPYGLKPALGIHQSLRLVFVPGSSDEASVVSFIVSFIVRSYVWFVSVFYERPKSSSSLEQYTVFIWDSMEVIPDPLLSLLLSRKAQLQTSEHCSFYESDYKVLQIKKLVEGPVRFLNYKCSVVNNKKCQLHAGYKSSASETQIFCSVFS